jgi:hypothetical protein
MLCSSVEKGHWISKENLDPVIVIFFKLLLFANNTCIKY